MKIIVGSIIVILIVAVIAWFLLSFLFKPIGNIVKNKTVKFKENMEELDE